MEVERTQLLASILQTSHEMLEHARDGHWHRVAELEAARRAQVEVFFANPVTADDGADVAAAIREVLRFNEQVTRLGMQARDRVCEQHREQKIGDKARRAYRQCAART